MKFLDIKKKIPAQVYPIISEGIEKLRPAQEKAVKNGLLSGKSLLICTPTASGKTLIAEMAAMKNIVEGEGKAVYIVPLKALANEKYKEFSRKYGGLCNVNLSIGELDKRENLEKYDFIVATAEKLDSLIRHHSPWLSNIKTVIIDEIHLLNDPGRGPTLEILITILRQLLPKIQLIGLSATIGNPSELADWLDCKLIEDKWRPVKLHKGIMYNGEIEF